MISHTCETCPSREDVKSTKQRSSATSRWQASSWSTSGRKVVTAGLPQLKHHKTRKVNLHNNSKSHTHITKVSCESDSQSRQLVNFTQLDVRNLHRPFWPARYSAAWWTLSGETIYRGDRRFDGHPSITWYQRRKHVNIDRLMMVYVCQTCPGIQDVQGKKHREKTHRQKKHTEKKTHTEKTHREKTHRENTQRKHREKTQKENRDRKHREKVLHSTPRRSRESSPGPPASKANALSARQIFCDDHIQKIVIANTMRGAIVQIQNTNVHTPRPMRGAIPIAQNLRFATVSRDRPTESYERVHPAKSKRAFRYSGAPSKMSKCAFRYSGVRKNVWNERMASAVARGIQKSSFYHSFGRPTNTKWREGCASAQRICISPQFWASDEHEVTRGLLRRAQEFAFHHSFGRPTSTKWREGCFGDVKNLHFTTVLGVRRARSDERVVSRRDLPNLPCGKEKKKEILKRSSIFEDSDLSSFSQQLFSAAFLSSSSQQLFSAAFLSSPSQQLFSAAFLSSSSQQLFSAAFLSSSSQQLFSAIILLWSGVGGRLVTSSSAALLSSPSQQLFSAALLSSLSQQLFSAALLSSFSQQPFSAALLSSLSQQLFSAALLSSLSQQLFSAALLSYHLAVVWGWWSASNIIFSSSSQQLFSAIILLWSGVGGQLVTSSSAALLSSLSQQPFSAALLSSPSQQLFSAAFLSSLSQQLFSAALLSSSSQLSSCCGQGLVVKYATVL